MKNILFCLLITFSFVSNSQINVSLNRNYGGPGYDQMNTFMKTADGGFCWGGFTTQAGGDIPQVFGNDDAWFMKVDGSGDSVFSVTIGGSSNDAIKDILELSDTSYVVLIESNSSDNGFNGGNGATDLWIKGLYLSGTMSSGLPFGGSSNDFGERITTKNAGGYIVTGYTYSSDGDLNGNYGMCDLWVMSLQSNLSIAWSKHFGGSNDDRGIAAFQLSDGNIMVFGNTQSDNHDVHGFKGMSDVFVMKLTSLGDTIWTKTLGGSEVDYINEVKYVNDSTFALVGVSNSSNGDFVYREKVSVYFGFYYVIDANGVYQYGNSMRSLDNTNVYFSDVIVSSPYHAKSFGIAMTDSLENCTSTYQGGGDLCIADFYGMFSVKPYLFGGTGVDGMTTNMEQIIEAEEISTNKYAICANSNSDDAGLGYHGSFDVLLNIAEVQPQSITEVNFQTVTTYPNPAKNIICISEMNDNEQLNYSVFDIQGKLLLQGVLSSECIDISALQSGIYVLNVANNKLNHISKFLVE